MSSPLLEPSPLKFAQLKFAPLKPVTWKHATGVSLTEILVAMTLGLFVMIGMIKVLNNVNSSQNLNQALSESQETGRFALYTLTEAVQQSGYYGCLQPLTYTPQEEAKKQQNNPNYLNLFFITPVAVFPSNNLSLTSFRTFAVSTGGTFNPDPSANARDADIQQLAATNSVSPDTDVLNVQYASSNSAPLTADMTANDANITIDAGLSAIKQGDHLIIGDCSKADLFIVTNNPPSTPPITLVHAGPDPNTNWTAELNSVYKAATTSVRFFHNDTYYVSPTGVTDNLGQAVTALMRRDVLGNTQVISEGVSQFKISLGEMDASGKVRYFNAGGLPNTRKVTQVHISITTRIFKEASDPNNPYFEKTYQRSVQLRNRS